MIWKPGEPEEASPTRPMRTGTAVFCVHIRSVSDRDVGLPVTAEVPPEVTLTNRDVVGVGVEEKRDEVGTVAASEQDR